MNIWGWRATRIAGVMAAATLATGVLPAAPAAATEVRKAQWHLDYLKIAEAQRVSTGQGVVVAVVDSGVHASHPDLAGQVVAGADLVGGGANGMTDEDSHGTAMSGLIAAKGGGPTHAYGVAPGARIMPIRVFAKDKSSNSTTVAGIRAAADRGAKVINVSLSSADAANTAEREAIAYALSKDAVVVAGGGNVSAGQSGIGSPANTPGVIAVTAFDQTGAFWSGSAQGPEAVLSAPGKDIVTTGAPAATRTGYTIDEGTSDAAAIVTGVVALVRAKYPNLDAANVINRLIRTADDAGPAGRDPQYGFGRVNPVRALSESVDAVSGNPLGNPTASSSPSGGASGGAAASPSIWTESDSSGLSDTASKLLCAGLALVLIGVLAGSIAFLVRRSRRRAARESTFDQFPPHAPPPGGYPGYPAGPPPGYPPQGPPPGHPGYPPGSFPPPGGYPPPGPPPGPPQGS